jgi:APA family basic amino acid/polyamine antiporter
MDTAPIIDTRYNRILTLKDLVLLGLSMTIGSGVFVLLDDVAKNSHNLVWLAMMLAGIMSLLTALSYGELASIFKNNMGEYGYVRAVSNDTVANTVGLGILISDVFVIATIALGLGNYLSKSTGFNVTTIAVVAIVVLNYFNYHGIKTATTASRYVLYIKLMVIVTIIVASLCGNSPKEELFSIKNATPNGISTATIIGLFAYVGFNNMTNFTEETINPEVTIGRSIMYTVIIVTILYTLISFATLFVMNSTELSQTSTPLATITGKLFGKYGFQLLMVLAVISLIDTLLVTCVSESRYIHAFLSRVSPRFGQQDMDQKHQTPYLSIILLVAIASLIIYTFKKIGTTAIYGNLLIMAIFIIVNLVVIILRYQQPDLERPFKIPFNLGKLPIPSVLAVLFGVYGVYKIIT